MPLVRGNASGFIACPVRRALAMAESHRAHFIRWLAIKA
jgi:hypothetical protein